MQFAAVTIRQTSTEPLAFTQGQGEEEVVELPFDEEHELALSVRGADDAFRLPVSAEVGRGVRLPVARLAVALHSLRLLLLLLRLHAGLQRERQGQTRSRPVQREISVPGAL